MTEKKEIPPEERAEIVRLHQCRYGLRRIAVGVGRDRKTVRRILVEEGLLETTAPSSAGKEPKASAPRKLLAFREAIGERIEAGLTGARILREIREQGYRGGRTILLDYMRERRGPVLKQRKAFRRFETRPGEEAQVDWSPSRLEVGGRETTVHTLSAILCHSRKLHVGFYSNERLSTLLEGLELAFQAFQGVTQRVVFDNMATVVLGRIGKEREPLFHPRFLEFAKHYGFAPFACEVRDPNRKGKIERPFPYIEADFLRGKKPASLDELNRQGKHWVETIANQRVHGTTRLVPDEVFEKTEKSFLVRLPSFPFASYPLETREVGRDCVISVLGTRFTVPSRFAEQEVRVRVLSDRFEVLDKMGEVVATHVLAEEQKGTLVIVPEHYEDIRRHPEGRHGDKERTEDRFLRRFPGAAAFLEGLKSRMKGLAPIHLRLLFRLAARFGDSPLLAALRRATEFRNYNAEAVRRILEREFPLLANEALAPPDKASGAVLALGEVQEPAFDEYAHLDTDASAEAKPGEPASEEEASDAP